MPPRSALYTTAPLTYQDGTPRRPLSTVPLKSTATTGLSSVSVSHQPRPSSSSISTFDNPLFTVPNVPIHAKVAELRGGHTTNIQQPALHTQDSFSNLGFETTPSTSQFFAELFDIPMWNQPVGWDTLLSFDASGAPIQQPQHGGPASASSPDMSHIMTRNRSDPGSASYTVSGQLPRIPEGSPSKLAQMGSEMVWKTILASQVEVEGVGQVAVSKVLREVWQRGGGDIVSKQCLWAQIIVALSPSVFSSPTAHAALSLQNLYNLTLRHWEPSIFSGLLAAFDPPELSPATRLKTLGNENETLLPMVSGSFGIATPQKELDFSQWTNGSPGMWNQGMEFTAGPSGLSNELASGDAAIQGLDEMLAQMEENRASAEIEAALLAITSNSKGKEKYQIPTPESDSSGLTAVSGAVEGFTPPSSHASPISVKPTIPSGQSALARPKKTVLPTPEPSSQSVPRVGGKKTNNLSLAMPTTAFVPPPPMCMFFSPSFHDLQKDKVGVWKGDLEIRGRGGGKFSVLIVGEQSTGHLWQSNTWPSAITYPAGPPEVDTATATATMIPVSHLAREGFTPAAMGMVLCNDSNIEAYVQMVQGLHAEGVAFHLSSPGRLPIVFLPAKFDSSDQLQRLGIAYMTKAGHPLPQRPSVASTAASSPVTTTANHLPEDEPKKKRRKSAPAGPHPVIPRVSGKGKKRSSLKAGLEETIVEEQA